MALISPLPAADKFVKVTDAIKGSVVRTFEGHTHHVMGVSWRRTGREILSSGADKDLKYWNFENGDRLGKGGGFRKEVTTVHFIGAGTEAIATSAEGKISVVRSGSNISQANSFPNVTKYVHAADVTPDGNSLPLADKMAHCAYGLSPTGNSSTNSSRPKQEPLP